MELPAKISLKTNHMFTRLTVAVQQVDRRIFTPRRDYAGWKLPHHYLIEQKVCPGSHQKNVSRGPEALTRHDMS